MVNIDYKTLTMILASRLMKVLQLLISPDQTGFLKGRYLGDAILLVINIINFGKVMNTPTCALFVDVEKAFDRVE